MIYSCESCEADLHAGCCRPDQTATISGRDISRIKKLEIGEIDHLLFEDEFMITDYQALQHTWFLKGKQRIITTTGKHRGVKLLATRLSTMKRDRFIGRKMSNTIPRRFWPFFSRFFRPIQAAKLLWCWITQGFIMPDCCSHFWRRTGIGWFWCSYLRIAHNSIWSKLCGNGSRQMSLTMCSIRPLPKSACVLKTVVYPVFFS